MTTDAQTEARRANSAKRREAARAVNLARGEAKARRVLALVEQGHTEEEMAEHLGIAVVSVRPEVSRARRRLGVSSPSRAGAGPERGLTLDLEKLVDLLSADAQPSNVVPLPAPHRILPSEDAKPLSEVV